MANKSDIFAQNELFNNIQKCRVDVEIMINNKKTVDEDTIKAAQALARDIKVLSKNNDAECIVAPTEFTELGNKNQYLCLCDYAGDEEAYGLDFKAGEMCVREAVTEGGCYMASNINGTSVLLSDDEMEKFFKALF